MYVPLRRARVDLKCDVRRNGKQMKLLVTGGSAYIGSVVTAELLHLIPLVLQVALGQRPNVSVFGTDYPTPDGTCVRDYIHVSDLASAHVLALEALGKQPEPERFDLQPRQWAWIQRARSDRSRAARHRAPDSCVEAPRRAGDPAILVASSDKIKKELNWQQQHPDLGNYHSQRLGVAAAPSRRLRKLTL